MDPSTYLLKRTASGCPFKAFLPLSQETKDYTVCKAQTLNCSPVVKKKERYSQVKSPPAEEDSVTLTALRVLMLAKQTPAPILPEMKLESHGAQKL